MPSIRLLLDWRNKTPKRKGKEGSSRPKTEHRKAHDIGIGVDVVSANGLSSSVSQETIGERTVVNGTLLAAVELKEVSVDGGEADKVVIDVSVGRFCLSTFSALVVDFVDLSLLLFSPRDQTIVFFVFVLWCCVEGKKRTSLRD